MNFIIYLLDGLTPLSIKNKCNKNFFGKKINTNYLSSLQKQSINFSNSYGYGETFATSYQYMTGKNIYTSYCDSFNLLKSFPENKNLASYFKEQGFNTILFRDAVEDHPLGGFYGRYFRSISKGFDYICLKKKNKKYNFEKFFFEKKINKLLNNKNKNFFFFHDYTLHDNPLAYKNASAEKYLHAVTKSSYNVKLNLNKIKYNKKKDYLIFLSDHGLNLSPYDKLHFNKPLKREEYIDYYKNLLANEKIKTTFFVKYPKVKMKNIDNLITPKDVFNFIKNVPTKKLNTSYIKKFSKNSKKDNIIMSYRAAERDPFNNFFLRNYFHCHFIFLGKYKYISYSHNHLNSYYDMFNGKNLKKENVNLNFKQKIEEYFSLKNYFYKSLLLIISLFVRFIKKIL